MPYVRRNDQGQIESVHRGVGVASEFVGEGDSELLDFVGGASPGNFDRLDAGFVRVLEDLLDTLVVKNILNITDLPEQAQAKLFARKSFRERVSQGSLRLFEPTDFGDII